jgi:hypothetical protein
LSLYLSLFFLPSWGGVCVCLCPSDDLEQDLPPSPQSRTDRHTLTHLHPRPLNVSLSLGVKNVCGCVCVYLCAGDGSEQDLPLLHPLRLAHMLHIHTHTRTWALLSSLSY